MPRTKKPAGQAVDTRNGRRAELSAVVGGRFDAPEGLGDDAKLLWEAYWADVVSSVQTPVDRGVLLRWITEHDRYWRLIFEADKSPLVLGSQGQEVANPLYKIAERALAAAERCEKQLGIGGLNRSNLGIAVITEQRSLADMNSRYGGGHADGNHLEAAPTRNDPRVIDISAR